MKVLEKRFLRGPNIYRMSPCFVSLIDLQGHRPIGLQVLPSDHALLQALLPGGFAQVIADASELVRLLARLLMVTQAWAGRPGTFCDALTPVPTMPGRYRLVCDYQHEAVADAALHLSVDIATALLKHQPFDIEARLSQLKALGEMRSDGCVSEVFTQPARLGHLPVVAVTGTNGKTTTTQLIAHVLRAGGARTGAATTQGIYIDGQCVQTGDCSGYRSARRVLSDHTVEVAALETARGGILKRGLAFDHCDVGVVLNVSSDHLGLDGVETLQDLARVKGLVARCARTAAVLNADDALCVAMLPTLAPGCRAVYFTMNPQNPVFAAHLQAGGAGACLDADGWLVWCSGAQQTRVVRAAELPFTWMGQARYNTANALAALAALRSMGCDTASVARSLTHFESDAHSNPLRGNRFEVEGVRLIVDYAHNVVAYRAVCEMARSMVAGASRLVGVITSPGDRRAQDLFETGQVCAQAFDELVVYEQDPRGRRAGATTRAILRGARHAAPGKPLHGEPRIRHALWRGLNAARPGDVLLFTCAGSFDDLIEGIRLKSPAAAERIAREVPLSRPMP